MKHKKTMHLCSLFFTFILLGVAVDDCRDLEQTCLKVADVSAKAVLRCNPDRVYEDEFQAFLDASVYGDCKTVKNIKDIDTFKKDCLPWLQRVPCALLNDGHMLPSCMNQFEFEDKTPQHHEL